MGRMHVAEGVGRGAHRDSRPGQARPLPSHFVETRAAEWDHMAVRRSGRHGGVGVTAGGWYLGDLCGGWGGSGLDRGADAA